MLPQETVSHDDIHDYPLIPWKEVMCPEHETTRSRLHPSSCQLSPAGSLGRYWGGKSSLWFPSLTSPHPYLREVVPPHAGTCRVGKPHERVLLRQARKRTLWISSPAWCRVTSHGETSISPPTVQAYLIMRMLCVLHPLAFILAISLSVSDLFIFRQSSAPLLPRLGTWGKPQTCP